MANILEGVVLGVHLVSAHIPAGDGLNNVNPGVYVRAESGWTAGVYRNSLKRTSVYGGFTLTSDAIPTAPMSLTLGAVTGYEYRQGEVICTSFNDGYGLYCAREAPQPTRGARPLIAPSALFPAVNLRVSALLPVGRGASAAVHLSFERPFSR